MEGQHEKAFEFLSDAVQRFPRDPEVRCLYGAERPFSLVINIIKGATEPCFIFTSATLEDLLVTLAAPLPGGVFESVAGKSVNLSPVWRQVFQFDLDAPGAGADVAHEARSH